MQINFDATAEVTGEFAMENTSNKYDMDLQIVDHNHLSKDLPVPSGNPCTYSATCSCARTCGGGC